ncbi:MAG TPA: glycoside hydrolase family 92 protein, partial [Bacteroidales bacterium]|nr:glycoside hydrolase family 92 protein [Bacteroidales bacterium]
MKPFTLIKYIFVVLFASTTPLVAQEQPVELVNPFIGSDNYGTTNPGAVRPNGMMSVSPFNVMGSDLNKYDKDKQWWSTPYSNVNSFFTGYSHVNLSGVGCPDLGSLLLMPTTGELNVDYKEYGSIYSDERAVPGYYSNILTKYNIKTEVTATDRSSIARFTFPKGEANILMNLGEGLTNESGAWMRRVSQTEIEGMKLQGTFCYNPQAVFPIYFVMRVNKQPVSTGYWKMQREMQGVEAEWDIHSGQYKLYTKYNRDIAGDDIGAYFSYDVEEGEIIEVQIGVSFVSTENAWENLETEQSGFNFDAVRKQAYEDWNKELSRVKVEGGTYD